VEDRLPLLIQKRLNAEIQRNPPLFPWETETEVDEYDKTEPESGNPKLTQIPEPSPEPNCDAATKADAFL
jgi:hypothetical protein